MKSGLKTFLIILAIIAVLAILLIGPYNRLVSMDEEVNNAYSQVQTVMQRRSDLIPNLVSTVKGYASHEKEVLEEVTKARAKVDDAKTPGELAEADQELSKAIADINVVVEAYPELKADKNFMSLQDELAGTENRIAVERKRYNDSVGKLNQSIRTFPNNIIASLFRINQREYFEASETAQTAPSIDFGN